MAAANPNSMSAGFEGEDRPELSAEDFMRLLHSMGRSIDTLASLGATVRDVILSDLRDETWNMAPHVFDMQVTALQQGLRTLAKYRPTFTAAGHPSGPTHPSGMSPEARIAEAIRQGAVAATAAGPQALPLPNLLHGGDMQVVETSLEAMSALVVLLEETLAHDAGALEPHGYGVGELFRTHMGPLGDAAARMGADLREAHRALADPSMWDGATAPAGPSGPAATPESLLRTADLGQVARDTNLKEDTVRRVVERLLSGAGPGHWPGAALANG